MAYDPKSYLNQALKTGFTSHYTQPVSRETQDEPQYEGDWATFGNVTVRPTFEPVYEGTGDAQYQSGSTPSGHMVSAPLTGKYEGYFRNDIYDNDGNFLRTTLTEPDNDKYGLKSLAQLGMMAASFGGLGPIAQGLSSAYKGINAAKSGDWLSAAASILPNAGLIPGVDKGFADTLKTAGGYAKTASTLQKAIENKDILGLLEATSGIPGAPKVPTELTDVLKGVGQANKLREAISSGNPEALFREVVGLSKTGVPFSKLADVTGGDAIEGFFAPGGEGYDASQDANDYIQSLINSENGLPQDMSTGGGDLPDWALDPYKDATATATADDWYQEGATPTYSGVPEWDDALDIALQAGKAPGELDQTIGVTGTLPKNDVIIPDWDFMEEPDRTPGSPTDTTPGTVSPDDDRRAGTDPAGGTKTTGTKTTAKPGMSPEDIMKLLLAMQGQQPKQEEDYRLFAGQPLGYDLMYGLRG